MRECKNPMTPVACTDTSNHFQFASGFQPFSRGITPATLYASQMTARESLVQEVVERLGKQLPTFLQKLSSTFNRPEAAIIWDTLASTHFFRDLFEVDLWTTHVDRAIRGLTNKSDVRYAVGGRPAILWKLTSRQDVMSVDIALQIDLGLGEKVLQTLVVAGDVSPEKSAFVRECS